jgi:hypothetical protein
VIVAVCTELMFPADAEKVAVVAPEETVTLAGTVTAGLLLESPTALFPEAAPFRVTVQFDSAPLAIAVGVQVNEVICLVGAFTVTVAWADPL